MTKITVATNVDDEGEETLKAENIQPLEAQVVSVFNKFKEVKFNQQMMTRRMKNHYENTRNHNFNIKVFSMIETILILGIIVGQFLYIKKLIQESF
jgi:hypothetical protein